MQLTRYTDYSLRVLLYLSLKQSQAKRSDSITISEIAEYYNISRNHLVKVVHQLANDGFINTTRGKGGGIRLAHQPKDIRIGDVVRKMEPNFDIVECFNPTGQYCEIETLCALKNTLGEAASSFLSVLDKYTLADGIIKNSNTSVSFPIQPGKPAKI